MMESSFEQDRFKSISMKSHEEILALLDEIKGFERRFEEFEIQEPRIEQEFIEVEQDGIEEINFLPIENEIEKAGEVKRRKHPFSRVRLRSRSEVQRLRREGVLKTPTVFKVRFNEGGNLVNIDLKRQKPERKPKSEKRFSLSKFRRKGTEKQEASEVKSGESRFSKLKGGLSKLGKLRGAIPSKSKKEEKSED